VGLFRRFLDWVLRKPSGPHLTAEESSAIFRARYVAFKQLLDANNRVLRIIGEMEQALSGTSAFGMAFIRSRTTAACVNVYTMVSQLRELSGGKYGGLEHAFSQIENEINIHLACETSSREGMALVLPLEALNREMSDAAGGKMAILGEIRQAFPWIAVPDGFVVTSAAFELFMRENDLQREVDRLLQISDSSLTPESIRTSSEVQLLILESAVPRQLEEALKDAYARLEKMHGAGVKVCLRSSAVGEDTAQASFAGQYRSELNVSPDSLLTAYKEVVASKYSPTAIAYRQRMGIPDHLVPMGVGCMPMVCAAAGGVVYSRNPVEFGADQVVINSVPGLPGSVVDGSGDPDRFLVEMTSEPRIVQRAICPKTEMLVAHRGEGVQAIDIPPSQRVSPSISDDRALELARLARALEEYFNTPVDIEWVIDQRDQMVILQCRPLAAPEIASRRMASFQAVSPDREIVLKGGETASPGVAAGTPFVVRTNEDLLFFPDGALLVAAQARPRWAALLPRAAGVITEHGSITGHLANVAREFRTPALFNVRGAMAALDNAGTVTMDADTAVVYEGLYERLLEERPPAVPLMQGTYIHELLAKIMQGISPLNLTDPDSIDFKPERCLTLHDITRFCHEKGIQAMFELGKDLSLVQRASKRLLVDVPMQWWVLDLADGFSEPIREELVHVSKINSLPMLALWQGIVSHPWEGPPPIDGKGFMSVMVEATANPDLITSGPSVYANRNYFMISKNFCNLTSRMGFHFSTVEALVGDPAYENSIRFSFKGGAADYKRRCMRTSFLGQLLSRYDFQVELYNDGLFARIRGGSDSHILELLKILGYVIIHARQLDMIMTNKDKAGYYFEKMCRDIASLTGQPGTAGYCPIPLPGQQE
jgi:pyruvate, water dikinase